MIEATDEGDVITVSGAFTERLQHGVYVLSKAMNLFVDKIVESGNIGYSSAPPASREELTTRKPLPRRPLEATDFSGLR